MSSNTVGNWDDFIAEGEEIGELASSDFFEPEGRAPIKPGRYISKVRELTPGKTKSGNPKVSVKFNLDTFTTVKGEKSMGYPPYEDLYFHKQKSFDGTGEISAAGRYLRACGQNIDKLTPEGLKVAFQESANVPIVVIVGWEQDFRELGTDPETGAKERPKKTAFFKDANGEYHHQVKVDDRVYTARSRVVGYEPYKG